MTKIKLTAKQKKMLMGAVGGVLLVAVGAFVLMKFIPSDGGKEGLIAPLTVEDAQSKASEAALEGDVDKGLRIYDEQIEMRKGKDEERLLLVHKANFALGLQRYGEALESAERADALGSNIETMGVLARVYKATGDKQQALEYSRKVVADLPEDGGMGNRYRQHWESQVEELEQ